MEKLPLENTPDISLPAALLIKGRGLTRLVSLGEVSGFTTHSSLGMGYQNEGGNHLLCASGHAGSRVGPVLSHLGTLG